MTRYGRSPWIDRFPKSRLPAYPRHRGHLDTDVIIVGGGLVGCTTAYAFAAAGLKVVLIDAAQLGRGSSGSALGWIADTPGVGFEQVETAVGLRDARRAWQAWRRAALDFAALVRRLGLKCQLAPSAALVVARTQEQAALLKRELKTRRGAGIDTSFVTGRATQIETGMAATGALRTPAGATVDPYRATLGLAAAAAERGAAIFERSPATKIKFGSKSVLVQTDGGTLGAGRVVVATGRPTPLYKALMRHFWPQRSFFALTDRIPAKVRRALGRQLLVVRDAAEPPHHLRWFDEDRLLVTGADEGAVSTRPLEKIIVQRTGQLMYELSTLYPEISGIAPAYGWEAPYGRTADGLPYIGPHRNFPRHLFAFGCASHSITDAYLASRILLRHYRGEPEPADEVFGFTTARL
jgi:glycine/D-amino acid oxidase-like deaminating enzyme